MRKRPALSPCILVGKKGHLAVIRSCEAYFSCPMPKRKVDSHSLETMCFVQNNAAAHGAQHSGQHNAQANPASVHLVARIIQQHNLYASEKWTGSKMVNEEEALPN